MRAALVSLVAVVVIGVAAPEVLVAHAGPRSASPAAGSRLGDSPEVVRLSFTEPPEVGLSTIRVFDANGMAYQAGEPERVANDPHSMLVRVRPLDTGIFTVSWRVVSAVDGHATEGSYSFGVRAIPAYSSFSAQPAGRTNGLEVFARAFWIGGLLLLLGTATAHVLRFGGPGELWVACSGLLCALTGVGLLIASQVENSPKPLVELMEVTAGRALASRLVTMCAAAVALSVAATRARLHRHALIAVGSATLAGMAIHVAAGHAAAGAGWQRLAALAGQWAHFAAAGVWFGGLVALLVGTRGMPSKAKATAVGRFSVAAGYAFVLVLATGILRTASELSSWRDLLSHPYGQTLAFKSIIVVAIAALAAWNRRASVPFAQLSLSRVRVAGGGEAVLAIAAVAFAAMLGVLAPPRAGVSVARELTGCGSDFAATVRVCVSTASDEPGANRFVVRATDLDSHAVLRADRVTLRFVALEDAAVAPTSLVLQPTEEGTHAASGANLAFPGRWRITASIEHAGDSVDVPIELETSSARQSVAALRVPGSPPEYLVTLPHVGQVHVLVTPERAGRNEIQVAFLDMLGDHRSVDSAVFWLTGGDRVPRQAPARQTGVGRFALLTELPTGVSKLVAAATLRDGTRMRSVLEIVTSEPLSRWARRLPREAPRRVSTP